MSPEAARGAGAVGLAGIGLELVSVARFGAALERFGAPLVERLFLPDEAAYARGRPSRDAHLAVRFAAKCAARRALRPLARTVPGFRELEVERARDGRPTLVWRGPGADPALRLDLSLTHERDLALASVLVSRAGSA